MLDYVLLRMNVLVISTIHEFYNFRFLPGDHYCFAKIIKIDLWVTLERFTKQ